MIRIIFFGSPTFAVPSLEALAHDGRFEIMAVVTQPDKLKGRSLKLQPTPIAQAAEKLRLPIIKAANFKNNRSTVQPFNRSDLFVVVAYGALLPASLLSVPKHGAINLHPSLLPRYRGASPIQAAILNGDRETGVTVMRMDEELDHGPILWQETEPIGHHDTALTLSDRLARIGAKLLITTIPIFIKGGIAPQPQDHAKATFTKKISKEDGNIDWSKPAYIIARMVRAFHPWPRAWTNFNHTGQEVILKIVCAVPTSVKDAYMRPSPPPGTVKKINSSCTVACGHSTFLRLDMIQPAGKKPMSGEAFLNGYQEVAKFE